MNRLVIVKFELNFAAQPWWEEGSNPSLIYNLNCLFLSLLPPCKEEVKTISPLSISLQSFPLTLPVIPTKSCHLVYSPHIHQHMVPLRQYPQTCQTLVLYGILHPPLFQTTQEVPSYPLSSYATISRTRSQGFLH